MDLKEKIAEIWKEVLGVNEVNYSMNIMEMGADSLKVYKICALAKEKYKLEFAPMDVMMYSSIDSLTDFIQNGTPKTDGAAGTTIRPAKRRRIKS